MNKTLIVAGIIGLAAVAGGAYYFTQSDTPAMTAGENTADAAEPEIQLPTDTVGVQDVTTGTGAEVAIGSKVTVNYTGALPDGTIFDSSIPRGEPFTFTLGEGTVIPGWEAGLLGMREGGKRILAIPPQFAYGDQQYGPIPPNSTLIFEVDLLKVE